MFDIDNLTVGFGGDVSVIAGADLHLEKGARLLVCGAAGCGKSTLMNVIAGIVPTLVTPPAYSGEVKLNGNTLAELGKDRWFTMVASLAQNAEDQLWDLGVEDLIAFPLENRGVAKAEIRARVAELIVELDLGQLRGRRVLTLSGGERRMVAIAAAIAARPEILVLDEPTTGLDPAARQRLVRLIEKLSRDLSGVVIAEQDPASLQAVVDQVSLLDAASLSTPVDAAAIMSETAPWEAAGILAPRRQRPVKLETEAGRTLLAVEGVKTELKRADGQPVLENVALDLKAGEVVGLIGRNGAGKTTLFQSILGLAKMKAGTITIDGEAANGWTPARRARSIAYLPQNMRRILFNMTVIDEVLFAMTGGASGGTSGGDRAKAAEMLARYGIGDLAEANPFALSARQQALLGLACAEAASVKIAILDEPLLARDLEGRRMLQNFLATMTGSGCCVLLISHDLELIDDVTSRSLILEKGRIAFNGKTSDAWGSEAFAALGWPAPYAEHEVLA
ncbi:ATP-binding cassette domain-containing protein [Neorhizobium sp. NCHU2750]|uniref:ABC transporter ATP-binding protein n=1 Tax=Neorhizobium sp. NCHU2750 TaxID=1825976 RepID=UPI000E7269C4|nr:sugar ABC transporter ATP-binding protein [Neorhizobium sp. NCHU2750]